MIQLVSGIPFASDAIRYNAQPAGLITAMGPSSPVNTWIQHFEIYNVTLLDENYDGKVDYKIPFKISDDLSGVATVGGKYHGVRRESGGSGSTPISSTVSARRIVTIWPKIFPWITYGPERTARDSRCRASCSRNYNYGTFLDGSLFAGLRVPAFR